ncbi:MAG: tRNA preQ1(34) S-adenosylmethionine ribosyltransferase-isomerase QueA [Limisphaerales bacterium]|jgi:S-adenosylmethionine:tRNA ribosyltransferase-isomerase|nr:tRNA preQ1(34) S-adenosylmethionine ribosyltransferase-isomerase QueA [Verrucomicrobiota bacterium]
MSFPVRSVSCPPLKASDFDFDLPQELIAQHPAARRSDSRLMVFNRQNCSIEHRVFLNFPDLLREGDLLILNDTQVIPARLFAQRATGRKFEILLLERLTPFSWKAMIRSGREAARGGGLQLLENGTLKASDISVAVTKKEVQSGAYHILFTRAGKPYDIHEHLLEFGRVPLPPYIERAPEAEDVERYQTVFARHAGSVAAPTAGLHFTPELLNRLKERKVEVAYVTLHVGPGTFAPVKSENLDEHPMHEESFVLSQESASAIKRAKNEGRRVIPVGTTSMRVIESVARQMGGWQKLEGAVSRTRLFIYPPSPFYVSDALLTNFHFPHSTLLMLVSAFAEPEGLQGRERVLAAYRQAVEQKYRFFSYGDAMFIQ